MKNSRVVVIAIALVALALGYYLYSNNQASAPVSDDSPGPEIVQGQCATIFDGEICTWGTMIGDEVIEFGATVAVAMAENAPLEGEMVFPPITYARIDLPAAITDKTGINHLGINWETHGHPPGPFLTPHFDFHFNTVSGETIEAIDCEDLSKPESVPTGYALPDLDIPELGGMLVGLCVPTMGMHALEEAEMNATDVFDATMVVGYYSQDVIFVEPMISRDKLLEKSSFAMTVPLVEDPGEYVTWPNSFEAVYDVESNSYRFVFTM